MKKKIYNQRELKQGSKKWLDFRKNGIGASEIPILTSKFPTFWCDDHELFLIKMGNPYTFDNEHKKRGSDTEPKARKYIEEYLKYTTQKDKDNTLFTDVYDRTENLIVFKPKFRQYTIEHNDLDYVFSSFDGLDINNKLVLELKCPTEKVFDKFLRNRVPTVPKMYYDQVQTQLEIARSHYQITKGLFAIYNETGVLFKNKKTKEERIIRLILIDTSLDENYWDEVHTLIKKFHSMIEKRCWNKNWKG